MSVKTPSSFGSRQFSVFLGIPEWQFERAVRIGQVPGPDRARRRWSRAAAEATRERLAQITAAAGAVPDMGASRAAEYLTDRLGADITADAVAEMGRQGGLRTVVLYKGHPVYDGRDLEAVTDPAAAREAGRVGRQLMRAEVAEQLGVREVDVRHLDRAGYLPPIRHVRSSWQRRREEPRVPLYRLGDVLALQDRDDIDWKAVHSAVKPGGRSPFAGLPTAAPA